VKQVMSSRVYYDQFLSPDIEVFENNNIFWMDFEAFYIGVEPIECGTRNFEEFSGWMNWS